MAHVYEIIKQGPDDHHPGCTTFTIDGIPSLMWFDEKGTAAAEYKARRMIARLRLGRSDELKQARQAGGESRLAQVTAACVEMDERPTIAAAGIDMDVPNSVGVIPVGSDNPADESLAVAAFLTRGKLKDVGPLAVA